MFGTNPIRKAEHSSDASLWVQEIFSTIQGEGPFAGTPAVFIRLAGCNLRCWWCDTEFESAFEDPDNHQGVSTILDRVEDIRPSNTSLIVLTGGEPLRQTVDLLVSTLLLRGLRVQVETAGTIMPHVFPLHDPNVSIVCSPKTPKLHASMRYADAWKYILRCEDVDPLDGLPTASTQRKGVSSPPARPLNDAQVFVQPCDEQNPAKNKLNLAAAVQSCFDHGHRLTTQMHKEIGLP